MGADVGLFGKFAKAGETQARQKRGGGQFLGSPEPLPSGCNQWDYRPSFATNRAPTLPRNGAGRAAFSSGAVRVLPRAALLRVSLLFVVALTGIEPATSQFSSVPLGLSNCVFGAVQFATRAFVAVRMADVLPWCCPAAGIRLIAGQSDTVGRLASIFLANVIQPSRSTRGPDRSRQWKNALGRQPILVINWPISAEFYAWLSLRASEVILVSRLARRSRRRRSGPGGNVRRNISRTC